MTGFLKTTGQTKTYLWGITAAALVPMAMAVSLFVPMEPLMEAIWGLYLPAMLLLSHWGAFRRIICPVCERRLASYLRKNILLFKGNSFEKCPKCGLTESAGHHERVFFGQKGPSE